MPEITKRARDALKQLDPIDMFILAHEVQKAGGPAVAAPLFEAAVLIETMKRETNK
jgi:hypothetical protein